MLDRLQNLLFVTIQYQLDECERKCIAIKYYEDMVDLHKDLLTRYNTTGELTGRQRSLLMTMVNRLDALIFYDTNPDYVPKGRKGTKRERVQPRRVVADAASECVSYFDPKLKLDKRTR